VPKTPTPETIAEVNPYSIDHGSNSRRKAVEEWLFGLDLVTPDLREKIVTAWVSTGHPVRMPTSGICPIPQAHRITGWSGTSMT
jgi:hypothetical protein